MISWINPIIAWMYLIYMVSSMIAVAIIIVYLAFKLLKKIKTRK